MVATVTTSAFFSVCRTSDSIAKPATEKPSGNFGGRTASLDAPGIRSISIASKHLQVKANAQVPPKVNGAIIGVMDNLKPDEEISCSPPTRSFINWSILLTAFMIICLEAKKQWMMLKWKPKRPHMLSDSFDSGTVVQDDSVFRQNISIRSYEIGADRAASVETVMNHLQETSLNHLKHVGLLADGFGSTQEMYKKNLIWVVTKMEVVFDGYPTWGDVVQVYTWLAASGKNCIRRDWLVRDYNTGEILIRASSYWVAMNKQTRRLTKLPDEVRAELECHLVDTPPVVDEDRRKLPKLKDINADYINCGLTPRWSDLDVNQHVNNVKYVGWILESTPQPVVENYELASMTLEYRRECLRENVLDSLTSVLGEGIADLSSYRKVECQHLLRLDDGAEILKGRTIWRPKSARIIGSSSLRQKADRKCS